jgi:DNA-binding transcriptional ArsR family regulator
MTVADLAAMAGVTPSAISHHMVRLRSLRIVRSNREGNQVFYSIDDRHISNLYVEALNHLDHVWRVSNVTSASMDQGA